VEPRSRSKRAADLATRLEAAANALIAVVEPIDPDRWRQVPGPGVWSVSKDVEHVAEAAVYHQWIVRTTIGQKVSSRRPGIERLQMVSGLSPQDAASLVRERTVEGRTILLGLTDEQLDQPTRPLRARGQRLHETIELLLIGHYNAHRAQVEAKLRA